MEINFLWVQITIHVKSCRSCFTLKLLCFDNILLQSKGTFLWNQYRFTGRPKFESVGWVDNHASKVWSYWKTSQGTSDGRRQAVFVLKCCMSCGWSLSRNVGVRGSEPPLLWKVLLLRYSLHAPSILSSLRVWSLFWENFTGNERQWMFCQVYVHP